MTEVEVLDLSDNLITDIPDALSRLTSLKVLRLTSCRLMNVANLFNITQLTSLEELYLSDNPIKRLPEGLTKLHHLRKLHLKNCGLTEIGTDITQLTSLGELDLSENPIKRLPEGFAKLHHLRNLHLRKCRLTEIGTDITQLTSLEELILSKNPVKELPESFSNLHNLKGLYLCGCRLTKIGTAITQLTSLEELELSGNPIKRLPDCFAKLCHLKKLYLSTCGLTDIGTDITSQLTSLEELYFSENPIKRLPEGFAKLHHLRSLHLRNCRLTEIGTDITQMTSLEELYLSENPIKRLPEGFTKLCHLKKLYLTSCGLTEIGTDITSQLTSLEELHLSGNPIKRLPEGFAKLHLLRNLDLRNCGLTEIGADITQLTSLGELDLSENPIKRLPEGFAKLHHLKVLCLYDCGLTKIGTAITQLTSLEVLNLSENPIQRLPEGFAKLHHLRILRLRNCRLTEIGTDITQLTSLRELGLSSIKLQSATRNQLTELPLDMINLKNLQTLDLKGNPITVPPVYIWQRLDIASIFSYLSDIRLGKVVHQKVVLLGSSGAGKTSLAQTLIENVSVCVPKGERTEVLDRIIWEPSAEDNSLSIVVIDFGGQDWYKIVHHLFIEENALFLLAVNLTDYSNENFFRDIGSWLNVLLTRVPGATFKLVATHVDECTLEDIQSKCKSIEGNVCCIYGRQGRQCEEQAPIRLISSKTMEGISELRAEVLDLVCKKGKVIPTDWLELYKKLQSPQAKPYHELDKLRIIDQRERKKISRKRRREEESSQPQLVVDSETRLQSILNFFNGIGAILWYQHIPELSQFVFHNPEYLTNLLKAIFSERLETEALSYDNNVFRVQFTPDEFQQAKEDLLVQGIMSRDLLRVLWKYKQLEEKVFDAMIQLFIHLDFCYPLSTNQEKQVTSLRFPWFLTKTAPGDVDVKQILFELPADKCHRLTLEYEFLTICPPPLYEQFAVRMHGLIDDKNSRIDWKDGVYAAIQQSRVALHRTNRPTETVISLTVEGRDVVDLWEVLISLDQEMRSVVSEWPGMRWKSWLVCPHCLQYGVSNPCKFPGKHVEETCPEKSPYVTCRREKKMKVPSCLVYPVKGKLKSLCIC